LQFDYEKFILRTEFESTYRRHEIHGLNGPNCSAGIPEKKVDRTSLGTAKCQADKDLRIYTSMVNSWGSVRVFSEIISVYAGGGVGTIVADGLGHTDAALAVQAGVGIEAVIVENITLDLNYKAVKALTDMSLDRYELHDYSSYGPNVAVRFNF